MTPPLKIKSWSGRALLFGAVFLGGFIGGVLRSYGGMAVEGWLPWDFPVGTLAANIAGCVVIGWAAAIWLREGEGMAHPRLSGFVIPGFCGGLTTFSFLSFELLQMLQEGAIVRAALFILLSLATGLGGVWAGWGLGRMQLN